MFERFRRSHASQTTEGPVATRERELDETDERARFDREPVGERTEMAPGDTATSDTALDRERARDDLGRDETAADTRPDEPRHDEEHHHGRDAAVAAGGAAAGAAAMHHHEHREAERDEAARDDHLRDDPARDDPAAFHDDGTRDDATGTRGVAGEPTMLQDRDRDRDLDRDGVDDGLERHDPVLAPAALETMRSRQRDSFGGIQWGSDFFGWLCAIGLAALLTSILVGAGVALGLSTSDATNAATAQQIGLGGGIALLIVLAIAWFCGGYVAGRMARFDGARQGIGVWLWTILAAIVVAAGAAIGGSEYDIFQRLNLPRIAVGDSTLNAGGAIAGAAAIVVTLLFAVLGGKVGERFHRRVDRVATAEYVVERER